MGALSAAPSVAATTLAGMTKRPVDLRAVRYASGKSLPEVTEAMGYANPAKVNTFERQHDWLLSNITKFIGACGGTAQLVVEVNGEVFNFIL